MPKLYMNTGLQLMPLSASSQISLSRRPPWKESSPYISTVSKKGVVVTVPGTPPSRGADGGGAREASQASEKIRVRS